MFKPTIYGKAQWMTWAEKQSFLSPSHKGLVFGKYRLNFQESYKNLCLIAPTGSGKTTRYVIPNILKCNGSIVVTDPSGEIYKLTSGFLSKKGYFIQILSPADLQNSLKFNPLSRFKTKQELKQLATIIGSFNAGSDSFWTTGAISIIYVCLVALSRTQESKHKHIGSVRNLLLRFGVNGEGIKDLFHQVLDEATYLEFKAFIEQDDRVIASILSTAKVALDLWSDPHVVNFSSTNTVDIEALREKKTAVFIIVPEHRIKYFSLVVNLFYSSCFEYCIQQPKGESVFFFLDEFGNIGKINNFETIATTLRKRKCSISVILQAYSQLESVYGKTDSETIWDGGTAHKLFFSGLGHKTCHELEQVLGKYTQEGIIDAKAKDKDRTVATGTSLMTADQIRMMKDNEAVLITGNKPPAKLHMKPFFKDRVLLKWTKVKQKTNKRLLLKQRNL